MCGRYTLTRRQQEIVERFGVEQIVLELDLEPRYNIAPSQEVPAITSEGGARSLTRLKWGLVPFWVKDRNKSKPLINARAETVAEKPSFKRSLARRRCLLPADGFYEWLSGKSGKTPMYIFKQDREMFGFAGLWDEWRSPEGEVIRTCTILTTDANEVVKEIHDRMPVILTRDAEDIWLDDSITDAARLSGLLRPLPREITRAYEVSSAVNSPARDLPQLVEPVSQSRQLTLPH